MFPPHKSHALLSFLIYLRCEFVLSFLVYLRREFVFGSVFALEIGEGSSLGRPRAEEALASQCMWEHLLMHTFGKKPIEVMVEAIGSPDTDCRMKQLIIIR